MDSKFGKQFGWLRDYRETPPATAGIQRYLGSGLIKGFWASVCQADC